MNKKYFAIFALTAAIASALLAACSSSHDGRIAANSAPAVSCADLAAQLSLPATTIESVELDAGGNVNSDYPDAGPTPENCVVKGVIGAYTSAYINPDTGSNAYGTHFELRLPTQWNGRFLYQGGGGGDGFVAFAAGPIPGQGSVIGPQHQTPALWRGYAVVSSDGGHATGSSQDAYFGGGFGIDPTARINYGYASIGQVTPIAKQIIKNYYAKKPAYSYFTGCSKGAQEGMQASIRYGDQFDGVMAGDPGLRLPRAAVAMAWNVQALAAAALANDPTGLDSNGNPLLYNAFSTSDLELIRAGAVQACDALDGLADNMILNQSACAGKFDPAVLQCTGAKNASCLSFAQVTALHKIFDGAKASDNRSLYAAFPYDSGIDSFTGWPLVNLGALPGSNSALSVRIGTSTGAYIFNTPPDPDFNLFSVDVDEYDRATRATSGAYTVSAVDFMNSDSTDLDTFKKHGGKIIYYHGSSDPIFSAGDTADFYERLSAKYGKSTPDFARLFLIPGMNHCAGGDYAADFFDGLDMLVNWVEKGQAPDAVAAGPDPSTKLPAETKRPLCAYPTYAHYKGRGDTNDVANYSCENP